MKLWVIATLWIVPLVTHPANAISPAITKGARASSLAVRGPQTQLAWPTSGTITVGSATMPWYDYSQNTPSQVQVAIDQCVGGILFFQVDNYRLFGAHNTSCPPDRSFSQSLEVNSIVIDDQQYTLVSREQRKANTLISKFAFPGRASLGLQTSISNDDVVISWFERSL